MIERLYTCISSYNGMFYLFWEYKR